MTNKNTLHNETDASLNELGPYDVICARDKAAFNNIGNRRFRVIVSLNVNRYISANTRKEKSVIVREVTENFLTTGGRFFQRKNETWEELDAKSRHEKVSHALRDMASKSSTAKRSSSGSNNKSVSKRPAPARSLCRTVSLSSVDLKQSQTETAVEEEESWGNFSLSSIHFDCSYTQNKDTVDAIEVDPVLSNDDILQRPLSTRSSCDSTVLSWLLEESKQILDEDFDDEINHSL